MMPQNYELFSWLQNFLLLLHLMKLSVYAFALSLFLLSCGGSEVTGQKNDLPDDSVQLRIAVTPTLDCLPVFIANECGVFDAVGLDVNLKRFQAQMDCDTAIMRGSANAIVTDLVRVQRMKDCGLDLQLVTATDASWQLLAAKKARISQLRQLDNKMVAMTRFSATHLLTDKSVDSGKVQPERVFQIQVNDVDVRLNMLQTEILDALWLPEPQATSARNDRANVLLDSRTMDIRLGVVAFERRAATHRQTELFKKAYNIACDSINERGLQAYREIIRTCCNANDQTVDSLPELHFAYTASPREADSLRAVKWLRSVRQNYSKPDSVSKAQNKEQKNPRTSNLAPRTLKDTSHVVPRTSSKLKYSFYVGEQTT